MPRIMIDVSTEWFERWQAVAPASIEAMQSWEHQIRSCIIEGTVDPADLLENLLSQIIDARRSLESARHMF